MMYKDRIIVDPEILTGKPVVKGTRIPVELVLKRLAQDLNMQSLFDAYPRLTEEDVKACLEYAQALVEGEEAHPDIADAADYSLGVVTGNVIEVSVRPALTLTLIDELFGSLVYCYLDDSQQDCARQAWGKRVAVTGMVLRDPQSGRPIEIRNVSNVEIVKDAPQGSYKQARGVVPWRKGDEPAEVTIRRIRDAG